MFGFNLSIPQPMFQYPDYLRGVLTSAPLGSGTLGISIVFIPRRPIFLNLTRTSNDASFSGSPMGSLCKNQLSVSAVGSAINSIVEVNGTKSSTRRLRLQSPVPMSSPFINQINHKRPFKYHVLAPFLKSQTDLTKSFGCGTSTTIRLSKTTDGDMLESDIVSVEDDAHPAPKKKKTIARRAIGKYFIVV